MGLSNGGYFAHLLGCERPKAIAAIAPAAGGSKCEPRMPLPVIISHGTTDTLVGYDQAVAAAQAWARRNPSLDEGFGFPPLEAMACGTPTVASSAGALAENLSGAAVLVDPSAAAIQLAVARVLHDPARLESLRAAGFARARQFTWENTARATRACYEELARHA
jgi:glycosyltransferase involved in cell wall biosynthesis